MLGDPYKSSGLLCTRTLVEFIVLNCNFVGTTNGHTWNMETRNHLVEAISKFRKTRHAYELLQLRKPSGRSYKLIWDLRKSQDFYRDREELFQASSTKQRSTETYQGGSIRSQCWLGQKKGEKALGKQQDTNLQTGRGDCGSNARGSAVSRTLMGASGNEKQRRNPR